jgi:hypothetical protein
MDRRRRPLLRRYTHGRATAYKRPDEWGVEMCGAEGSLIMFAAVRFVWNATSGHRFRPWRSEYLKWRIETYSGLKAEELKALDVLGFVWQEKWNLLRFLQWTDRMESLKRAGMSRTPGATD